MTLNTNSANKLATPIGLFITLILFMSCLIVPRLMNAYAQLDNLALVTFVLSRVLLWCILVVMYWYAVKVEKQRLVMWKEQNYGISFYLISIVALLISVFVCVILTGLIVILFKLNHHSVALAMMKNLSVPLKLFGIVTAAIVEEYVFRAYLMPRLQLYLKYRWLTVLISAIIFGLAHLGYGTLSNILVPVIVGLVFGFHYYKYRNVKVLIICHALIDFYALIIHH